MKGFVLFHTRACWGNKAGTVHIVYRDPRAAMIAYNHAVIYEEEALAHGDIKYTCVELYSLRHNTTIAKFERFSDDHDRWIDEGYEY